MDCLQAGGYILIQYIDDSVGTMLSHSWEDKHHDKFLRANLFKDLSQIILKMARVPIPRIGSFIIDDNGLLMLSNRPLSIEIQEQEGMKIPVDIPRDMTYESVDSYIADIFTFHDNRLLHQPNAINNRNDGIIQVSALTAMRTVTSRFFQRDFRRGPFVYTFNDIHQSNIFVDKNWNIKCLIDLEWACSRPIEMLHPPYWLSNQAIDTIETELYAPLHQEFMSILEFEEKQYSGNTILSKVMQMGWEKGTFWFSLALQSTTALYSIFYEHIRPKLIEEDELNRANFQKIMKNFWIGDINVFIKKKLEDRAAYDKKLQEVFDVIGIAE